MRKLILFDSRHEIAGSAASVGVALAFYGVFIGRSRSGVDGMFTLFDDAMISMRYADNLADGHGLVWNLEGQAVEGYSNLLWTLWMAVLHRVGLEGSNAALAVMITGALLLALTALTAGAVARHLTRTPGMGTLATVVTGLCYPLLFWTLRGMEVGLLAFLITGAILLCLRIDERPNRREIGLLTATVIAMTLTRADALLFGVVILGWLAFRSGTQRRVATLMLGAVAVMLAAHTALRLALYGDPLPNTYYLKLAGIPLDDRLHRGFQWLGVETFDTVWLASALAFTALVVRRTEFRRLSLLAAVALAAGAYSVWVGGDAWEPSQYANRYISVALPALFALAACGVATILETGWRVRATFVALVVTFAVLARIGHPEPVVIAIPVGAALVVAVLRRTPMLVAAAVVVVAVGTADSRAFHDWFRFNAFLLPNDGYWARLGVVLNRLTPPDATIAVTAAGATPYYARRHAVDILGKNDAHIAHQKPKGRFVPGHNKWDYDYSIGKLRPDVIVQLYSDPPSPEQMGTWGYVKPGRRLYMLKGGKVQRETILTVEKRTAPKAR